ncbi:hypothetical protein [Candidatus Mycolicibacterium alkanivorans]|uniref:Uncharacterized protein n=1 Tax=Candidatus Mycolicibacterium alkanivorans TaxID=2954114 RepID=A0ABS9YT64_9MYCO|nr:hypothetical protein [Candidatus Mycolicibacterium alkanivorans]MCI4674416.1 hypothetical protein [Candidatus Mycolicibacterium alkanivorans]
MPKDLFVMLAGRSRPANWTWDHLPMKVRYNGYARAGFAGGACLTRRPDRSSTPRSSSSISTASAGSVQGQLLTPIFAER